MHPLAARAHESATSTCVFGGGDEEAETLDESVTSTCVFGGGDEEAETLRWREDAMTTTRGRGVQRMTGSVGGILAMWRAGLCLQMMLSRLVGTVTRMAMMLETWMIQRKMLKQEKTFDDDDGTRG
jgi:hypothetical protein